MHRVFLTALLLGLAAATHAQQETYRYVGPTFTSVNGDYTTADRVIGRITTSSPIPPNSIDFDISTIATGFRFDDGVQVIDDTTGVFHPGIAFRPRFTTDGAGNITEANLFVEKPSVATSVGATTSYITTNQESGFDHGVQTARCEGLLDGLCGSYRFGFRGIVSSSAGVWTADSTSYILAAEVSGLTSGTIVLQNNGGDDVSTAVNNNIISFPTRLAAGAPYNVTVLSQPAGLDCQPVDGSANMPAANLIVAVNCEPVAPPTFPVGADITGLNGSVTLQNNMGDDVTRSADGAFNFPTQLPAGASYSVTVSSQPAGQTCVPVDGSGTMPAVPVVVAVNCIDDPPPTFSVGGRISGLNGRITLQNNRGDNLTRSSNGSFRFATELNNGASYSVSILRQPVGQQCNLRNQIGTIRGSDVTNVRIDCAARPAPQRVFSGTLPSSNTRGVLSFDSADENCSLSSARFLSEDSVDTPPPRFIRTVDGLVQFAIEGCSEGATVTVTVDYGRTLSPKSRYWKVGEDAWYPLEDAIVSGSTVTFSITDNGPGDDDDTPGRIADPSGLVIESAQAVTQVPTLSGWALALLPMLLAMAAFFRRPR